MDESQYVGLTHHFPQSTEPKYYEMWKKVYCKQNMHILDEVWTIDEHYLYCDACGIIVYIDRQKGIAWE